MQPYDTYKIQPFLIPLLVNMGCSTCQNLILQTCCPAVSVNNDSHLVILVTLKPRLNVPLMHLKCIFYLLRTLSSSRQAQPWILRGYKYKHSSVSLLCIQPLSHHGDPWHINNYRKVEFIWWYCLDSSWPVAGDWTQILFILEFWLWSVQQGSVCCTTVKGKGVTQYFISAWCITS